MKAKPEYEPHVYGVQARLHVGGQGDEKSTLLLEPSTYDPGVLWIYINNDAVLLDQREVEALRDELNRACSRKFHDVNRWPELFGRPGFPPKPAPEPLERKLEDRFSVYNENGTMLADASTYEMAQDSGAALLRSGTAQSFEIRKTVRLK